MLLFFSYEDYKHQEVENKPILLFFLFGLLVAYFTGHFLTTIIIMLLFFGLNYILWVRKALGGADVKILSSIIPYFQLQGFAQIIVGLWVFLIIFLITSLIYLAILKKQGKEEVMFVPAITISYIIFIIYSYIWII